MIDGTLGVLDWLFWSCYWGQGLFFSCIRLFVLDFYCYQYMGYLSFYGSLVFGKCASSL